MYVVLGENYDLTIEASELTQHVTSSSRPTANDNDDDARVTSPVDDDVELLAATKKKIRKKRKRSRKPEQTGEDITTEQIDKGFFYSFMNIVGRISRITILAVFYCVN